MKDQDYLGKYKLSGSGGPEGLLYMGFIIQPMQLTCRIKEISGIPTRAWPT